MTKEKSLILLLFFFLGGGWHLISKIKKKLREIIIYKNNLIKIFSTDEIHTFNFKC